MFNLKLVHKGQDIKLSTSIFISSNASQSKLECSIIKCVEIGYEISFKRGKYKAYASMPEKAHKFIMKFDDSKQVKPFKFTVNLEVFEEKTGLPDEMKVF